MSAEYTPLTSLPKDAGYPQLFFKREDQSESGAHKCRYFKEKLQQLKDEGVQQVVISTTGNAGITAAHYGKALGMQVFCFMHRMGSMSKAAQIEAEGGVLMLSSRPLRLAKYLAKRHGIPFLRMSKDPSALESYKSLGEELFEQAPDLEAVVNFATSGTSSIGIMQAYERAGKDLPALHLVQSGKSCGVVQHLHPEQIDQHDLQKSVGLSESPHDEALLEWIHKSKGDAHYVSQEALKKRSARLILDSYGIQTSWEGECCFLAAQKIANRYEKIAVIFSGKQWPDNDPQNAHQVEEFQEVDEIFSSLRKG